MYRMNWKPATTKRFILPDSRRVGNYEARGSSYHGTAGTLESADGAAEGAAGASGSPCTTDSLAGADGALGGCGAGAGSGAVGVGDSTGTGTEAAATGSFAGAGEGASDDGAAPWTGVARISNSFSTC